MSGPGKIVLGLMSEHDNRVHASGHGGQADPVLLGGGLMLEAVRGVAV